MRKGDFPKPKKQQRQYLLFCYSFAGCDTVFSLYGLSKETLFKRLCSKDVSELIDAFCDEKATKEHIVNAGIEIVQFICKSQELHLPTQ